MKSFYRNEIPKASLPGRLIQRAVGADSFSSSPDLTIGFAHYSVESGPMEPHRHAEEVIYVIDCKDGWVEYGPEKDSLPLRLNLACGVILHIPEYEWHAIRYAEGGFVDILFSYAKAK